MKAILIDALSKEVKEVQVSGGGDSIYEQIGNGCTTFCCPIVLDNGDTMYADDEGWFNFQFDEETEEGNMGGFAAEGYMYPMVGRFLILGCNEEGESVDCKSSVEDIKNYITRWYSASEMNEWGCRLGVL